MFCVKFAVFVTFQLFWDYSPKFYINIVSGDDSRSGKRRRRRPCRRRKAQPELGRSCAEEDAHAVGGLRGKCRGHRCHDGIAPEPGPSTGG